VTAAQLLGELRAAGVILTAAGGKLRYGGPSGVLTDEMLATIGAHKAELLALLAREVATKPDVPTSGEDEPLEQVGTESEDRLRIALDDLVYGDFLARHRLRIVGGAAFPDGRTFRPTLYLADDDGGELEWR
jgi:TubC N-terminal docking domain